MKKSITYDIGYVSGSLESQPVFIISKKGKWKINPLFKECVKNVSEEIKRMVDKQMSCKWLRNGDECGSDKVLPGTPCEVVGCVTWEHYKED